VRTDSTAVRIPVNADLFLENWQGIETNNLAEPKRSLLTAEEACTRLKVHLQTLYRWSARGLIPRVKLGRSVRFRLEDIEMIEKNGISAEAANNFLPGKSMASRSRSRRRAWQK
jgi:excisionase family DNA binding protein